jgi:hypothetical protein
MAEKRETIEELAKRESEYDKEQARAREISLQNSGKLVQEVPGKFFEFCGMLREAVRRFNTAADPQRRMTWRESTALAARDPNLNADFNCELSRGELSVTVALNVMGRSGKPDVYLIEGTGRLGPDRFLMRIEGFINKNGDVAYRFMDDVRRLELPFEELAERLVIAVIKGDYKEVLAGAG